MFINLIINLIAASYGSVDDVKLLVLIHKKTGEEETNYRGK